MSRDKRLQDRSIYPHWCSDTVRFSDQDGAGHVNNVAICAYMETARLTFMRDMGMMAPREEGVRGISAGMTVSFLAESHWPGKIELGTGVLKIGTSSITVASAAFKDNLCIAAAEMTVVRLKGKAPHPIDEPFRAALGGPGQPGQRLEPSVIACRKGLIFGSVLQTGALSKACKGPTL